jgi:hypothetical protein
MAHSFVGRPDLPDGMGFKIEDWVPDAPFPSEQRAEA